MKWLGQVANQMDQVLQRKDALGRRRVLVDQLGLELAHLVDRIVVGGRTGARGGDIERRVA